MGNPCFDDERHARAISRVTEERQRQNAAVRDGVFPWDCADPAGPDGYKLGVLSEEVGEVARILVEGHEGQGTRFLRERRLRQELTQVAAVATAWLESLDDGYAKTAEALPELGVYDGLTGGRKPK